MNPRPLLLRLLAVGLPVALVAADAPKTDIVTPDKRRVTVELAQVLTHPPALTPLPDDLPQPFNPPGFDLPDPDDHPPAPPPSAGPKVGKDASTTAPAAVQGDREILESLAAKLQPTGTIAMPGGDRMLTFGRKNVKVGTHFTVTSAASGDFDLELIAVDSTTFTLRYRNQEITRPIRSGK